MCFFQHRINKTAFAGHTPSRHPTTDNTPSLNVIATAVRSHGVRLV